MLTSRIYHWATQTPDKVAVLYNDQPISYATFAAYIGRARGYFVRRGVVGPGVAVLVTAKLMDFWILSLALRSLGLDTVIARSPEDIGALGLPAINFVATTSFDMTEALPGHCAAHNWPLLNVVLDDEPDLPLDAGPVVLRQGGHILTTSGTTGVHKKVLMDPTFEPEFFRIRRELAGVTARSVVNILNFHPSTGVGYKSPSSTWDTGGAVLIHQAPEPQRSLFNPGVTHVTLTPHLVRTILALPAEAFAPDLAPRVQISGGAVSQAAVDGVKARLGPNIYSAISSTETSTFTLTRLDTPDDRRWHRPAPGRDLQLVDEADRPVALGEVGRIRVSTQGGPTGYLHDAAATRAFFKDGYFYPGDLAIMRSDGRIALQGRATDVLNVAGDKISPAPLEERMEAELEVSGVCLLTMQNEDAEEEVHAVIESSTGIDEARVIAALPTVFASFSQLHYHVVESLPRNAMGKLLRAEVRRQILARHQARRPG
jgi:acyl-CoA synthetase (AMP-forming)/AMP-acid ligase II